MDHSRRGFLMSAVVLTPVVLGGCAAAKMLNPIGGGTDALLKGLGGLGVSPTQALGGAGSLMNVAKSALGADQFGAISKMLPGMDSMLGQAANIPGLGALPTDMAGAASAFGKLGMKPEQVGQFGNYITDYLGKNGGGSAAKMLGGVFKP